MNKQPTSKELEQKVKALEEELIEDLFGPKDVVAREIYLDKFVQKRLQDSKPLFPEEVIYALEA